MTSSQIATHINTHSLLVYSHSTLLAIVLPKITQRQKVNKIIKINQIYILYSLKKSSTAREFKNKYWECWGTKDHYNTHLADSNHAGQHTRLDRHSNRTIPCQRARIRHRHFQLACRSALCIYIKNVYWLVCGFGPCFILFTVHPRHRFAIFCGCGKSQHGHDAHTADRTTLPTHHQ